jgi:HNH endonuclease
MMRSTRHNAVINRFWEFVDKKGDDECWKWLASCTPHGGYGQLTFGGTLHLAHRVAWEKTFDEIPKGMYVCHRCDNPPCVNPSHLFLGNVQENTRDCVDKGRNAFGSKSGRSKLVEDEVREIRRLYGHGVRQRDLCKMFKVTDSLISLIVNNLIWKRA